MGQTPNAVTDGHFERLSNYYTVRQMTEIMAVISMFGFLNRWNDSLATALKDKPFDSASSLFDESRWRAGQHRK